MLTFSSGGVKPCENGLAGWKIALIVLMLVLVIGVTLGGVVWYFKWRKNRAVSSAIFDNNYIIMS